MASYFLGLDVSKGYADLMMLDAFKNAVDKGFQLDDTAAGHRKLKAYLLEFYKSHPDAEVFSAVESTGGYEDNWYRCLGELSESFVLQVARLNPARVKFNSEASAKRNKTDAISAQDVAEYLISHADKVDYSRTDQRFPMLRRQWSFIRLNVKQETQMRNHLESVLYSALPELLIFCRHGAPDWLLKILQLYPTYSAIKDAGARKLTRIPQITNSKAEALLTLLQDGIGESNDISGQLISSIAGQVIMFAEQVQQFKKLLVENYQEAKEDVELIASCNGLGVYSSVGLLMNMPPIDTLKSVKNLSSYWGVHPVYRTSGDGSWGFHMSKQGRSEPRAILYMASLSAIQYNPIIKELYARCKAKGMHSNAALGVCMHKLLRIIYGILKNRTPFDANVDRANQAKTDRTPHVKVQPKNRRLQAFDTNAPVSNRQNKKRKKQTRSQGEVLAECGIAELSLPKNDGAKSNDKRTTPRAFSSLTRVAGAKE